MEASEKEFLFLVQLKCNMACFLYNGPTIRKFGGGRESKKYSNNPTQFLAGNNDAHSDARVVAEHSPQPRGRHFRRITAILTPEWSRSTLRNHSDGRLELKMCHEIRPRDTKEKPVIRIPDDGFHSCASRDSNPGHPD